MMEKTGKCIWIIPDMFWPLSSPSCDYESHEAICVLNTAKVQAVISVTFFYEDRGPLSGFEYVCEPNRTIHIRTDKIRDKEGQFLPRAIGYSAVVHCSVPCVVQYTRVDTSQGNLALMTTMAY